MGVERSQSDRTSVTISKRVHHEFKVVCAQFRVTQRSVLERLIQEWINRAKALECYPEEEEG